MLSSTSNTQLSLNTVAAVTTGSMGISISIRNLMPSMHIYVQQYVPFVISAELEHPALNPLLGKTT